MNTDIRRSVTRNTLIMFGGQAITWIASFLLLLFLPRYLGSVDYGRLYLAISVTMILGLLIDFGGNFVIPKEIARSNGSKTQLIGYYLVLRSIIWVMSIPLIIGFSHLLGYSNYVVKLILILVIGKLWEGGITAFRAYFQGIERMEYPTAANIFQRVFESLVAVTALLMGANALWIAGIMVTGALINLLVIYFQSRKFMSISLSLSLKVKLAALIGSSLPYFLWSLFSVIYYRIDAIMLSAMTTDEVTGWYGGAYRFFDTVMVLPMIYKTAIFPVFSKLWKKKDGSLERVFSKSFEFMFMLAIPIAVLIFLFSEAIISFFMGLQEYAPSVVVLKIFAIGIPIVFLDFIFGGTILGAIDKQKKWAVIGFVAIFVNIISNYFLILYTQTYYLNGGIGAAVATLITETFIMTAAVILLPGDYLRGLQPVPLLKIICCGGIMAYGIYVMKVTGIFWFFSCLIGIFVFAAFLFITKVLDEKEIDIFKTLFSWKKLRHFLYSK